jgi:Flp pilus assembly protein TadD
MDPRLVNWLKTPRGSSLLLLLLGLVTWLPSLHSGYVAYDTHWLVVENPILNSGDLGLFGTIWTDLSLGVRRTLGSEYLPVRDTTVLLDFWLFGSSWLAHHAMNLVWYLGACLLLHRLLLGWLEDLELAGLMAALFMVHPVHVESVAWLASRKDVVSLFFFFAAIWSWERYLREGRRWVWASAGCMLLACWAKNTAIVLPAVLVLLALGKDREGLKNARWWVQWVPYGLVLILVATMSLHVGDQVGMFREPWAEDHIGLLSLQFSLVARYLSTMVWPTGLSAVYALPSSDWSQLAPWSGLVLLGFLIAAGTRLQRDKPLVAVGLGSFLVCLAPVSPWMSLQNLQADRYLLLPSAGLVLAMGAAWPLLRSRARPALIAGGGVVVVLALLTGLRCQDWRNTEALWRNAVEEQPGRVDAWTGLGGVLLESGEEAAAEEVLLQGLELHPGHARLLQSLGTLRLQLGRDRWTEAEADLRASLEADPTRMKAGHNLALLLLKTRRFTEALEVASRLTQSRPGYEEGWTIHGRILMQMNQPAQAQVAFLRAWQINPYSAVTTQRLARVAERLGDEEGARIWSMRTLEIEPDHPGALSRLRALDAP